MEMKTILATDCVLPHAIWCVVFFLCTQYIMWMPDGVIGSLTNDDMQMTLNTQ